MIRPKIRHYAAKKLVLVAMRMCYFAFCSRNKAWDDPEVMAIKKLSSISCSCFFLLVYFSLVVGEVDDCKLPT